MTKRKDDLYLKDMLGAIKNIENYTKNISFKKFSSTQMIIDAVVRNFEIIGEASKNLSQKTKSTISDIPWKDVTGMRNKIVHEYFGVDLQIIWTTIHEALPVFKKAIKKWNKV